MNNLFGSALRNAKDFLQQAQGALYNLTPIRAKAVWRGKDWQWKPEGRPYLRSRWNKPKQKLHGFFTASGSYKHKGIKRQDGHYVFPGDRLVSKQRTLRLHPGLNVTVARHQMNLIAMKEGVVRVTCEKPDLNWDHSWAKIFYPGMEGQTFFKKYFHVIPKPQHTRFKCIDQV